MRTFVLDDVLEEDFDRRKTAAGHASRHDSPAGGCARVVDGHSGPICVLCCCGQYSECPLTG